MPRDHSAPLHATAYVAHKSTPRKIGHHTLRTEPLDTERAMAHNEMHHAKCSECRHDYVHRDSRRCAHDYMPTGSMPVGLASQTVTATCAWCGERTMIATTIDTADVKAIRPARRRVHTIDAAARRRIDAMTRASH